MKLKKQILEKKTEFLFRFGKLGTKGNFKNSNNISGSGIINSENIENGYIVYNTKNGRNLIISGGVNGNENMFNVANAGSSVSDNFYNAMGAGMFSSKLYNCSNVVLSINIYYLYYLTDCSYCIGYIGLKNKSFCILNKQYSKEERFEKANEIFA